MKKFSMALAAAMMISFNANAFIVSPHVGVDYVTARPNGYGNLDSLNGATLSAGVKALGFVSVEGYYQQFATVNGSYGSKTKPAAYGVDLVFDSLNLGVAELLTSVGYGKYNLDGGKLKNKLEDFEDKTYRFGFGAQFNPTSSLGIRAMYRYVLPDNFSFGKNTQELSVGVRYYLF